MAIYQFNITPKVDFRLKSYVKLISMTDRQTDIQRQKVYGQLHSNKEVAPF